MSMMSVRNAMKTRLAFVAVLSLFAVCSFAANGTMKGDGSAEKPFQIEDYEDLKAIGKGAYLYSSNYVLTADIDASASAHEMCSDDGGCNGFIPIGKKKDAADSTAFWGTIDGQNHTISNLKIWMPCEDNVGFFYALVGTVKNLNFDRLEVTGDSKETAHVGGVAARLIGTIENVHVTNGFVQGEKRIGGIAGAAMRAIGYSGFKASIKNVSFQGEVKGSVRIGGIVGETDEATIDSAFADVDIIVADGSAGGIVGYNDGVIARSRTSGSIKPSGESVDNAGGIAGYSEGSVSRCVSMMDLVNVSNSYVDFLLDNDIGGIVGDNKGTVSECLAVGTIEGVEDVGGLVGHNGSVINNSYAIGSVRGESHVGGLVGGSNSSGTIMSSYAANTVAGDSLVGGLVGWNDGQIETSYWNTEISGLDTSAGGTGLSSVKMMKFSSFAGWDTLGYDEYIQVDLDTCDYYQYMGFCYHAAGHVDIWKIDEDKSFPYLGMFTDVPTALIPIALPTSAAKWQESPVVASLVDVGGELFGKWLGWSKTNAAKDSLYFGYRIGYVVHSDTVWGSTSYMAVPNRIEISSYEELKKIGNDIAYPLVANYELTKDIDASSSKFKPIGDSAHVFAGTFDGKNHTISNVVIDEPDRDFAGFFGVADGADIRNLKLVNTKVKGNWYVGALAGEIDSSRVANVVSLNGDVYGESFVGGLMGASRSTYINAVGSTGNVRGTEIVGGLLGASASMLEDAFSMNVVKGIETVAGIVAHAQEFSFPLKIRRVYSASIIKAPSAEGLVDDDFWWGDEMEYSYFDSTVSGLSDGGLKTEDMLKQATYETYDFDSVWTIQEGVSYPYFKGMDPLLPGTLVDDGTVNALAGLGTAEKPYRISRYRDLKYVGKYEYATNLHYKLTANINAYPSFTENCNADSTLCKGFEPIPVFSGVFQSNGKIIANLNINRPDEDSVGLFRALAPTAQVSSIVIDTSSQFTGDDWDYQRNTRKPFIRGRNYVGALAGFDSGLDLDKVFVNADVSGADYVGGIAGKKSSGSIARSASMGSVSGSHYVGGLAGSMSMVTVTDCYSLSAAAGEEDVGGLMGYSYMSNVKNVFASGSIEAQSKWGGLAGEAVSSAFATAYFDSTQWAVDFSPVGTARSTQDMLKQETYEGFDFKNTWRIDADSTYPYFAWKSRKVYPNTHVDITMMRMAGSGTDSDPFLIKTYGDLKSIGFGKYKLSAVYRLANNIDASASKTDYHVDNWRLGFKPIGRKEWVRKVALSGYAAQQDTGAFTGKFHGGGYSIDSLFTGYEERNPAGFIDTIAESAIVDSLSFRGYTVQGKTSMQIGGIAGINNGTIRNVDVDVQMDGIISSAGITYKNNGTIENVTVKGKYNDSHTATGIAYANYGTISGVKVDMLWIGVNGVSGVSTVNKGVIKNASVVATAKDNEYYFAGIVGVNTPSGSISESVARVDVSGQKTRNGSIPIENADGYIPEYFIVEGAGGIAAVDSGTIKNSTASGVIAGDDLVYVGGLVGRAYSPLDSLHASVDVTGRSSIGGLIGENNTEVTNCYATGSVKSLYGVGDNGGFVGQNHGQIEFSFATGDVESAAGFVGMNDGVIRRSYSTGDAYNVDDTYKIMASFAKVNKSVIEDCYSLGNVYGLEQRLRTGFIFNYDNAAMTRGLSMGAVYVDDGTRRCAGIAPAYNETNELYYLTDGCVDSLTMGTGLSSEQMTQKESFSAFDFESVWYLEKGMSYPQLRGMPNPPMVADEKAVYKDNAGITKDIRARLLEDAFVMDTAATKVLALDSASEALLDSLENAKAPSGKFEVSYRVGVLLGSDTLWSKRATMQLELEKTIGIPEIATASELGFGAAFRGPHVALRFGLASAGVAKFSLLDVQGRVVRSFELGRRAAGTYFETLAVENLARGRYIGMLQVNGKVNHKVLMLKK